MTQTPDRMKTFGVLALLCASATEGCIVCYDLPSPPNLTYKVEVIELQSPCPSKCSTLAYEASDGEDGALYVWPYLHGAEWTEEDSRVFDTAGEPRYLSLRTPGVLFYTTVTNRAIYPSGTLKSRGYDCALYFGMEIEPELVSNYVALEGITIRGRGTPVLSLTSDQLQGDDWSLALVGEFPLPTEDTPNYEEQIFHIIGGPDERVVPTEDACDDDPRSFWFDLQFTPVSPPQGRQR